LRIAAGDAKRMQNELKTTTGTVKTVHVQESATVETGAALITVGAPNRLASGRAYPKVTRAVRSFALLENQGIFGRSHLMV